MSQGMKMIRRAVEQSLGFYREAPKRGQAFIDFELALRTCCLATGVSHPSQMPPSWAWFDRLFAELQRAGYAVAPDKERTK